MNDLQPGNSTASSFFDAYLYPYDGSRAIPTTLANGIPETTPDTMGQLEEQDTVSLPALRLPQIAPSRVIATRQRSLIPATYVPKRETFPSLTNEVRVPRQVAGQYYPDVTGSETSSAPQTFYSPQTPRLHTMGSTPVTPAPNDAYYRNLSRHAGMTYIPRSMARRTEPTVVDTLIACGTLILLCFCVLLFLYYIGH